MKRFALIFALLFAFVGHATGYELVGDSTGEMILVSMYDSSDGSEQTGLAFGDVTITYTRNNGADDVDVTEATMTKGTWATGGWIEVDATNSSGLYQHGIVNAAIADGTTGVTITFRAASTITRHIKISLIDVDLRNGAQVQADVAELGGVAQSLTDLKDFADAGYNPSTNKVQGVVLVDTTTTNTDMVGTDGANTTTPLDAAGVRAAVGLAAADLDTQLGALSTHSAADIWTAGSRALSTPADYKATGFAVASDVTTAHGTTDTHLTDIKGATFSGATDSLEAVRDRGDAAWTTASVGGLSTHSAADVWTAGSRALSTPGDYKAVGFAVAGDAMTLAADAIKAVSYDETTAYPLKSADTGSTEVARTGADSDTLEDLSDEIALIAGDASAVNQTTIIGHLTDIKGATFSGVTDSLEAIRNRGDSAWTGTADGGGSESVTWEETETDGTTPVRDVTVEIYTDADCTAPNFIVAKATDDIGEADFKLDPLTYYVYRRKAGRSFDNNPKTIVVTAP